jgi:hypothetical protein
VVCTATDDYSNGLWSAPKVYWRRTACVASFQGTDVSGNSNPPTFNGMSAPQMQVAGALFSGGNTAVNMIDTLFGNNVSLTSPATTTMTGAWTVRMWIRPGNGSSSGGFVSSRSGADTSFDCTISGAI